MGQDNSSLRNFFLGNYSIGDNAIVVVRIVVVQLTRSIDIAHVVGVGRIRRLNNYYPNFAVLYSEFLQFLNNSWTSTTSPTL